MTYKTILTKREEGIWTITLNVPDKLNPLGREMYSEVTQALLEIENDPEIRVVVITGAGKSFSAGHDIGQALVDDFKESDAHTKIGVAMFRQIENSRVPIIAAVNGDAFGGGCKVAFTSDIAIAISGYIFFRSGAIED